MWGFDNNNKIKFKKVIRNMNRDKIETTILQQLWEKRKTRNKTGKKDVGLINFLCNLPLSFFAFTLIIFFIF